MQIMKSTSHNNNAKRYGTEIDGEKLDVQKATIENAQTETAQTKTDAGWVYSKAGDLTQNVLDNFKMNKESGIENFTTVKQGPPNALQEAQIAMRDKEGQRALASIQDNVTNVKNDAISEQKKVAAEALNGGMMSLMTGTQQLLAGGIALEGAAQLNQLASQLSNPTNTGTPVTAPGLPAVDGSNGSMNGGGAITGNGLGQSGAADASAATPSPPPDLGMGFNPNPVPSGLGGAPTPGNFNPSANNPSSGGGGGADLGGGNTSPASGSNDDPQATMAPTDGNEKYEDGGSYLGGGGGAAKAGEGGMDLSKLLEMFQKKDNADPQNKNGILQFGGQNGEPPFSILDKNANIFNRIHDTYQDKNRRGFVGQ
jgi:hypothetical protein